MKKFLNNLSVKFQRFMYGRYGLDQLYRGLLYIYLGLIIIAMILGRTIDMRIYHVISIAAAALIIFAFFRIFSKNIQKRRDENNKWLVFENGVKREFRLMRDKFKFRKTHIFKKCPNCKTVLRLKRVKGKHNVKCPNCKNDFEVKVH